MQPTQQISVDWIIKALTLGRMAEKMEAGKALESPLVEVDRSAVRDALVRLLNEDYSPGRAGGEDSDDLGGIRCWLLSALGRVPPHQEEPLKILKAHACQSTEPNRWARYWALEALLRIDAKVCAAVCQAVATKDSDVLPKMLANAVLAREGVKEARATKRVARDLLSRLSNCSSSTGTKSPQPARNSSSV